MEPFVLLGPLEWCARGTKEMTCSKRPTEPGKSQTKGKPAGVLSQMSEINVPIIDYALPKPCSAALHR